MKKSRFSEQQIAFVLRQAEEGTPVTGWRVACPVCRRDRQTRIPADSPTSAVVAEYDAHLRQMHGQESKS